MERRVIALEGELASPSAPNTMASELAEIKGALDASKEALRREKSRAAKDSGRVERVAKLEREARERETAMVEAAARARMKTRLAFASGFASGVAACAACAYAYVVITERAAKA